MTARCKRWLLSGALAVLGCGEARIGLLDPLPLRRDRDAALANDANADAPTGVNGVTGLRTAACNRWSAEREPEPALIMSIVDVSGTMSQPLPGSSTRKWDIERPVLLQAVAGAPGRMGSGILFFPNMATQPSTSQRPAAACVNLGAMVAVGMLGASDSPQRTALASLIQSTSPNQQGGAPTMDAYLAGLEALGRTSLDGSREMLIITDGQPTFSEGCVGTGSIDAPVDAAPLVDAISAARRAGIGTFVIGLPGSDRTNSRGDDARPWLSRAAEAGGTASQSCSSSGPNFCHYDLSRDSSFSRSLQGALDDIGRRIVRCDVPLPDPPQQQRLDLDRVNVILTSSDGTSSIVVHDDSQGCSNGWRFSNDQRSIILCSAACNAVNAGLGTKLELVFGCGTMR
jgi:hypothetical protein